MDESEKIRERISERLEAVGLKVQSASIKAGLSQTTLRDFMVGRAKSITLRTLTKLAPVLECTSEWLHTGRDAEPNSDGDPKTAELRHIFEKMDERDRSIVLDLARNLSRKTDR
jgi:DNA-binding Xre family transcriptional regulator